MGGIKIMRSLPLSTDICYQEWVCGVHSRFPALLSCKDTMLLLSGGCSAGAMSDPEVEFTGTMMLYFSACRIVGNTFLFFTNNPVFCYSNTKWAKTSFPKCACSLRPQKLFPYSSFCPLGYSPFYLTHQVSVHSSKSN